MPYYRVKSFTTQIYEYINDVEAPNAEAAEKLGDSLAQKGCGECRTMPEELDAGETTVEQIAVPAR